MEEEDRKGEIIVKATAIVHDSHSPCLIYLRCIGIILRTRSVMIPARAGPSRKSLWRTLVLTKRCGMSAPRDTAIVTILPQLQPCSSEHLLQIAIEIAIL